MKNLKTIQLMIVIASLILSLVCGIFSYINILIINIIVATVGLLVLRLWQKRQYNKAFTFKKSKKKSGWYAVIGNSKSVIYRDFENIINYGVYENGKWFYSLGGCFMAPLEKIDKYTAEARLSEIAISFGYNGQVDFKSMPRVVELTLSKTFSLQGTSLYVNYGYGGNICIMSNGIWAKFLKIL